MKKSFLFCLAFYSTVAYSQMSVKISASSDLANQEVYIYGVNGSKDIILGKGKTNNKGELLISPKQEYVGMTKAYFPDKNFTVRFISENHPISIKIDQDKKVQYLDEANQFMNNAQELVQKKDMILPVLTQISAYYNPSSDFGRALDREIATLSNSSIDAKNYPFVSYYLSTFSKYGKQLTGKEKDLKADDFISFINKSHFYLENSGLLRTILLNYLNISGKSPEQSVDSMMETLQYETPRGQTVLSEFIDIFDAYGMKEMKEKYLSKAQNLKCTINDRLANTIKVNEQTKVGALFPNYTFVRAKNTKAKTLHQVKANKKVVVFWSSTCVHCETELPKILEKYDQMKKKGIEVIGLSVDSDKETYENKASLYPWINDTELRGWSSNFITTYNVHSTPSYYILDDKNKIIAEPDNTQNLFQILDI